MSADQNLGSIGTLRKACKNCAKAKRRCVVRLPSCLRCAKKKLRCHYDLEPITAPRRDDWKQRIDEDTQFSGYCYLTLAARRKIDDPHAIIWVQPEQPAIDYVVWILQDAQRLALSEQVGPCIHPKLQLKGTQNFLAWIPELLKTPDGERSRELLQLKLNSMPLHDALTAQQTLLLFLIRYLFDIRSTVESSAHLYLGVLQKWTTELMLSASDRDAKRPDSLASMVARRNDTSCYNDVRSRTSVLYWVEIRRLPNTPLPGSAAFRWKSRSMAS